MTASEFIAHPELLDVRLRSPVAVYPNRANGQIRAQSGCFTLHRGQFSSNPNLYKRGAPSQRAIGIPISLHEIGQSME